MRSLRLLMLIAVSLLAACSSGRGESQCFVDSPYPYSGDWQPLDSEGDSFCLQQVRADQVVGTHGSGSVLGVVHNDGTLYLADERFPVTLRVLKLAGDTLRQVAFTTEQGQQTQVERWVRRHGSK